MYVLFIFQTVSKETTGPPTVARMGRSGASTDCVNKYEKVWSTESLTMAEVCVKVCTTTMFKGGELIETEVSHSDC